MSWGSRFWFPHTVTVRDLAGNGGRTPNYAAARSLRAEVKDEQRLVRTASGSEAASSSTVTVPIDAAVAPGALVTVWGGTTAEREAEVLAVGRNENAAPLPSYLVLTLA